MPDMEMANIEALGPNEHVVRPNTFPFLAGHR
jgi:hypothetical protein